jgi:hypothetical protein
MDMPFRCSSGVHWLRAMWHPRGSTLQVLFPSSFLHGGRLSTTQSQDWTYSLSPMSVVEKLDVLTLQRFMPLYYLRTRPPGVLNFQSPMSSPRGSSLWIVCSLYYTTSPILWILKSRTLGVPVTSSTTLAR